MDGQQIDDVARFAPVRRGYRFVGRQVHGVRHIPEKIVGLRREESKGAAGNPFKLHRLAETLDGSLPHATLPFPPGELQSGHGQGLGVGFGGCHEAVFRVLKKCRYRLKSAALLD